MIADVHSLHGARPIHREVGLVLTHNLRRFASFAAGLLYGYGSENASGTTRLPSTGRQSSGRGDQQAYTPPLMSSVAPVMKPSYSLARNTAARATSSATPPRPSG